MEGLGAFDEPLVLTLCDDPDPRIVEQAILAAEPHVADSPKLRERIARLADDRDARVRFHALVTAMPLPQPPKYPANQWECDAMLIATGDRGGAVLQAMLGDPEALRANVANADQFVSRLARLAAATKNDAQYAATIEALAGSAEFGRAGLAGFLGEATRGGVSLDAVVAKLDQKSRQALNAAFAAARADATNSKRTEAVRCEAIDLIAYAKDASAVLLPLAAGETNQAVRLRAIAALGRSRDLAPWKQLLSGFASDTPTLQRAILDGIFARPDRTTLFLDAIAAGQIKPTVVDPVHAKLLLNHQDLGIRGRAAKLLASAVPADREKVLAAYKPVLELKADTAHGQAVFAKNCSICHKIGDIGVSFAPDISDSRERTPLQLLTDILQPNRAIDSNYFSYTAITTDGHVHTGVLAAETSTSVTLKQQEGKSETLRRDEIDDLHNDGVSFMPEGLEKNISHQDMADLISFIKNWRYLDSSAQVRAAKR